MKKQITLLALACLFSTTSCTNPTFKSYKEESSATNFTTKMYESLTEFVGEEIPDFTIKMSYEDSYNVTTKFKTNNKKNKSKSSNEIKLNVKCDKDSEIVEYEKEEKTESSVADEVSSEKEEEHIIYQPTDSGSAVIDLLNNEYTTNSKKFSSYASYSNYIDVEDMIEPFEDYVDSEDITYYVDDKVYTMVVSKDYDEEDLTGSIDGKMQLVIKDSKLTVNISIKISMNSSSDDYERKAKGKFKTTFEAKKEKVSLKKKTLSDYIEA